MVSFSRQFPWVHILCLEHDKNIAQYSSPGSLQPNV